MNENEFGGWLRTLRSSLHDGDVSEDVRLAVKRGAVLLDAKVPGWWQKINLYLLELASGRQCVLGQVFDQPVTASRWRVHGFESAEAAYAVMSAMWSLEECADEVCVANYEAGKTLLGLTPEQCVENGFLAGSGSTPRQEAIYAELDVAWAELVWERQTNGG